MSRDREGTENGLSLGAVRFGVVLGGLAGVMGGV